MDCSLPGSSIHGIFQARVLEWGAIAFSSIGTTDIIIKVNSRIRKIQEQYPGESTSRCALLAMLNMSDEVIRLSEETNEFSLKLAELRSLRESGKDAVKAPVKRPFERARKPVGV